MPHGTAALQVVGVLAVPRIGRRDVQIQRTPFRHHDVPGRSRSAHVAGPRERPCGVRHRIRQHRQLPELDGGRHRQRRPVREIIKHVIIHGREVDRLAARVPVIGIAPEVVVGRTRPGERRRVRRKGRACRDRRNAQNPFCNLLHSAFPFRQVVNAGMIPYPVPLRKSEVAAGARGNFIIFSD